VVVVARLAHPAPQSLAAEQELVDHDRPVLFLNKTLCFVFAPRPAPTLGGRVPAEGPFMPTDNESCEVGAVGGLRFSAAGRNRDDDSRSS
jgi:hypothetical protein